MPHRVLAIVITNNQQVFLLITCNQQKSDAHDHRVHSDHLQPATISQSRSPRQPRSPTTSVPKNQITLPNSGKAFLQVLELNMRTASITYINYNAVEREHLYIAYLITVTRQIFDFWSHRNHSERLCHDFYK